MQLTSLSTKLIPSPASGRDSCVAVLAVAANLLNHGEEVFLAEQSVVFAVREALREVADNTHS